MVYTYALGAYAARCAGSSPVSGTIIAKNSGSSRTSAGLGFLFFCRIYEARKDGSLFGIFPFELPASECTLIVSHYYKIIRPLTKIIIANVVRYDYCAFALSFLAGRAENGRSRGYLTCNGLLPRLAPLPFLLFGRDLTAYACRFHPDRKFPSNLYCFVALRRGI